MKKTVISVIMASILTGCAHQVDYSNYLHRPIVDREVIPEGRDYEKDIRDCNGYAKQVKGAGQSALESGVASALFGAALGAAIGAALGVNPGRTAMTGAAGAGITGAAGGAVNASMTKREIVKKCMTGRGYNVLN